MKKEKAAWLRETITTGRPKWINKLNIWSKIKLRILFIIITHIPITSYYSEAVFLPSSRSMYSQLDHQFKIATPWATPLNSDFECAQNLLPDFTHSCASLVNVSGVDEPKEGTSFCAVNHNTNRAKFPRTIFSFVYGSAVFKQLGKPLLYN